MQQMVADQRKVAERQAQVALDRARAASVDVRSVIRQAPAAYSVIDAAAAADLVIMGQPNPDATPAGDPSLPADVILGCGRPVLCVPYAGDHRNAGRRIMVAWNGTAPSARAVHDALPLLVAADQVIVTSVGDLPEGKVGLAGLVEHLGRHGVKAVAKPLPATSSDAGSIILGAVSDTGADLLVMGAYGHSRMREFVLGGTSKTIIQSMTVPVLLSH